MYTMYILFNSVYTVTHSVITLQTNYTDIYSIHSIEFTTVVQGTRNSDSQIVYANGRRIHACI